MEGGSKRRLSGSGVHGRGGHKESKTVEGDIKGGCVCGKLCLLVVIGITMEGQTTEDSGCHGVGENPALQLVDVIEWGLFHEHGSGI